jgi:arabinose-5-phosphate isomerase
MHGDLGILAKGDALLVLSYSGESREVLDLIPLVRRLGVKIVALTGAPRSALAKVSDAVIAVGVPREACPFNLVPTTSTTATLAVGDALAIVLLEARGFRKEDYAKLHPGGAIGRALLLRVADIMRKGDRIAAVKSGETVKEAILAMTKARAGSACVVDRRGKLKGIFTDGDLRRHIAGQPNLIHRPVDRVMTAAPITVRDTALAVDVLRVFEERNIDDLPVVDRAGRLVGAIDIQDLPKLKIM